MSLPPRSRLGPYEVLAPLGAGGMGEVYRARDPRLSREVALKILPAELASDAGRLARFESEARASSSLSHPNIVTVYEIDRHEGVSYIAMELVQGLTLRALLERGPLPLRKLLEIAVQVAGGLARAHAAGIVHRDLKPDNVMVGRDGLVKILDFGLAKLTRRDWVAGESKESQTITRTEPGTVMGTVVYMSPEQASGHPVDFRSDQFSLGSMLYEMVTGKRTFQRDTAAQTMAAIIQDESEAVEKLKPLTPAPLSWIIERCLAKEPRNRYASTEDLAHDLASIRDHLSEITKSGGTPSTSVRPRRGRWMLAAISAGLLLTAGGAWQLRRTDVFWKNPLAGARFTRLTDWEGSELDAAISPDGKFAAFLADRDGPYDAFVLQIGTGEFLNLTKGQFSELIHERERSVGFSGDGTFVWLGARHMDPDGRNLRAGIWLIPAMGGSPRPFIQPPASSTSPSTPSGALVAAWSPDGSRILSHENTPGDPIFTTDRTGADRRRIFVDRPGSHCHYTTWSPDGRFIYFVRGTTTIQARDIWRIPAGGGQPERFTYHNSRVAYPTFLDERTLIYTATAEDSSGSGLYAMDVDRRSTHRVSSGLEEYSSVSASADGRRLIATVTNPTSNLWTVPIGSGTAEEAAVARFSVPTARARAPRYGPGFLLYLSSKGGSDGLWKLENGLAGELWNPTDGVLTVAPAISPDGARICFSIQKEGRSHLYLMATDGTDVRALAPSLDVRDSATWSPDSKTVVVAVNEGEGRQNLYEIPIDGRPPRRILEGVTFNPVWSPDGKFIVYAENLSAAISRVHAITPDGTPLPLPELWVRSEGESYRFLPDGKGLVLLTGQFRRQNFVLYDFATAKLRNLTNFKAGYSVRGFDVSPDGKRILFDRVHENSDIVLIDLKH